LGIEAPTEIPVYRHEIWEAVKAENQAAAQTSIKDLPSSRKATS
jgi:carbon storage regulator